MEITSTAAALQHRDITMFSTTPLTATSELPLRITFDPTPILREQIHNASHVSYDPETAFLTYQQDRNLTTRVQFAFPTWIDGYTVEVELDGLGIIALQAGSILFPPLSMYEEHVAEVRFSATSPTEKPPRPKFKIFVRLRPTGGG
jgi:hypothetical protein